MTITQVLYALEVARCHNFSKAADSLFVSQPALSLQIKNLEAELGYDLFTRTSKGISLTELGQRFCEDAQVMADSWHTFESKVQDHITALKEGALDLALDRLPPASLLPDQRSFAAYDLVTERQCILMARSSPQSTLKSMTFQDLQGCTIITALENSMEDRILKQECKDFGITLNRIYRSDGIDTNMNLARSGKGYVIGPESFAEYYDVAAVPLEPELWIGLKFICLHKNEGRPEIAALRRYLEKICRERKQTQPSPTS